MRNQIEPETIQPNQFRLQRKAPIMGNEINTESKQQINQLASQTVPSSNYHLNAALAWAENGIPVLPLNPKTKAPLINGGYKSATTDAALITSWWTANPSAMVGICTGSISKLFILDVDVKDGADPYVRLEEFEKFIGAPIPRDCIVSTPSGGLHIYMTMGDENLRIGAEIFGQKGIDYRANAGYVAAPPSMRADGKSYQFVSGGQND